MSTFLGRKFSGYFSVAAFGISKITINNHSMSYRNYSQHAIHQPNLDGEATRYGDRLKIRVSHSIDLNFVERKSCKEKIKEAHESDIAEIFLSSEHLAIYTDGSLISSRAGIGLVGYRKHKEVFACSVSITTPATDINLTETKALYQAACRAAAFTFANPTIKHWHFFSDSNFAIRSVLSTEPTNAYHKISQFLVGNPEATVEISWVPAHSGILGNQNADRLAKAATPKSGPRFCPEQSMSTCYCCYSFSNHDIHINKHWVERLALRASRAVLFAQEQYFDINKERLERRARNGGHESSGRGSGGNVESELALAFRACFEDLLEKLRNIKRDLGIYETQNDIAALMNKEKDFEMLEDHYEKLKVWNAEFSDTIMRIARMTRDKRETGMGNTLNEATTNWRNSGTALTPGPTHVRGNNQQVTMDFSSSSISHPVINNCGGDNISTSNDYSMRITIANRVVNADEALSGCAPTEMEKMSRVHAKVLDALRIKNVVNDDGKKIGIQNVWLVDKDAEG
ncbi:RnaseH-domain-containing protein [Dendrothele bispora CBS 962.96]|uniref:ribonuclease H n=1 Tax=Dendrothele bispora (strain CBS 962.96) TaxID=1314807 RepID=A0A4S8KV84_DENBC|nr:RnaseH-domain-containing protein [Dendrothele bispora CBS 962.96]